LPLGPGAYYRWLTGILVRLTPSDWYLPSELDSKLQRKPPGTMHITCRPPWPRPHGQTDKWTNGQISQMSGQWWSALTLLFVSHRHSACPTCGLSATPDPSLRGLAADPDPAAASGTRPFFEFQSETVKQLPICAIFVSSLRSDFYSKYPADQLIFYCILARDMVAGRLEICRVEAFSCTP
jgi:hypothetical protein